MESYNYSQKIVDKCVSIEARRVVLEVSMYLENVSKVTGDSSDDTALRHLKTIFANLNNGMWTKTMITAMQTSITVLNLDYKRGTIEKSMDYIAAVKYSAAIALFLEKLTLTLN